MASTGSGTSPSVLLKLFSSDRVAATDLCIGAPQADRHVGSPFIGVDMETPARPSL
jgi:hypothetical protein